MQKSFTSQIKQFGTEIKRLRKFNSLTQQELADRCDIDIRTIQRIEKGEFALGLQIVFSLAVALDVSPEQLFSKIKLK